MADAVSQMIGEVGTSIIDRRADYVLNLSLSGHFHSLTISESQFNPKEALELITSESSNLDPRNRYPYRVE